MALATVAIGSDADAGRTADRIFDSVRDLAPAIAARAQATETAGRVPAEIIALLAEAGVFRLTRPKRYGGLALGPSSFIRLGSALGAACGSTAWCACVSLGGAWLASMWSIEVQDAIWADDPEALICGTGAPTAPAAAAEGGYLISGAWPWASNCDNSRWAYLSCLMPEAEGGVGWFMVPIDTLSIDHDSWDVAGMRGTGSKTLRRADPLFVPAAYVVRLADLAAGRAPGRRIPGNISADYLFPTFGGTALVSPLVGMARGALEAFVENAQSKTRLIRPGRSAPVSHDAEVQAAIGAAAAEIDAAMLLSLSDVEDAEARVQRGEALDAKTRLRVRRNNAFVARAATNAINRLFELSGASSMALGEAMQRHWRDANFAARHVSLNVSQIYRMYGQGQLGLLPEGMY